MIHLQQCEPKDAGFIRSLFTNDEYGLYFAENDTTEQEWKDRFHSFSEKQNNIVYHDGMKIGWLLYEINGDICFLDLLVLKYECLAKGLGYEAFSLFYNLVRDKVKIIKLDVQQRNKRAVEFYLKFGFSIDSTESQPVGDLSAPYFNMSFRTVESASS